MADHVYKIVELTGSSSTSLQAAIENAVARAAKTLRYLRWFEVVDTRGHIEQGRIAHWQVTVKIGFRLDDEIEFEDDSDYYRHNPEVAAQEKKKEEEKENNTSRKRATKKASPARKKRS